MLRANPGRGTRYFFPTSALGPTQPLMQCVQDSFPGVKLSGRDSGVPRNFVRGGFQQIQLRTERGSGGGSPLPPSQGFWRQL